MIKGKKAFELTATFLVTLILIIVIFTGSIYFTKRFFSSAEQMRAEIDQQTEAEIEALLYQEGSLVAMPKFKKAIARGQSATFGLGIRNVLDKSQDFYVDVAFTRAFKADETEIGETSPTYIDSHWLLYSPGPYTIQNNELQMIPILANAHTAMADKITTEKGIYSFNVCVYFDDVGTPLADVEKLTCGSPSKAAIPEVIYGGKIYKMYVEVV
jgi:hypothetical protein